jgi:hypothetical protein
MAIIPGTQDCSLDLVGGAGPVCRMRSTTFDAFRPATSGVRCGALACPAADRSLVSGRAQVPAAKQDQLVWPSRARWSGAWPQCSSSLLGTDTVTGKLIVELRAGLPRSLSVHFMPASGAQRAMLHSRAGILTYQTIRPIEYPLVHLLLVQGPEAVCLGFDHRWQRIWEGSRPGQKELCRHPMTSDPITAPPKTVGHPAWRQNGNTPSWRRLWLREREVSSVVIRRLQKVSQVALRSLIDDAG